MRVIVTVAACTIALAHIVRPAINIDAVTSAFLVLALLPWLAPLVKSVELPGGFKVQLQEIKAQAIEAKNAAYSATRQAEVVLVAATATDSQQKGGDPDDALANLAAEYDHIRESEPHGPKRTAAMTGVVGRMIALAPKLKRFDVLDALRQHHRGKRLAAYAYLYAKPDPSALDALVHAITGIEDNSFSQYWALRSLGAVVATAGGHLPAPLRARLEHFEQSLDQGTDRSYELGKILRAE